MKSIERLYALGQSLWYDNIERRILLDGSLAKMIDRGELRGVTSNPTIFNKAISDSHDYDAALQTMTWAGWKPERIFFQLAIEDIQHTADLFLPVYRKTGGSDGFVSLEVNPKLAKDTKKTIAETKWLWQAVNRPNLMVKIPATREGIPAIRQCTAAGLNINITLIFSLERYREVMEAYLSGLEERLRHGGSIDRIASVASFFVSRVDTKVDPQLLEIARRPDQKVAAEALLGKAAIANARLAYELFQQQFQSPRFLKLKTNGARVQRPLWASTSTKNPAYRDVYYVEELIGPETVDTIPPKTLDAFREHGKAAVTLTKGLADARTDLLALEQLGIPMDRVTAELEREGVAAFSKSFDELLATIASRSTAFRAELGLLVPAVARRMEKLERQKIAARIWQKDATVWVRQAAGDNEIRERLGWLTAPAIDPRILSDLGSFADGCTRDGFTHALLLGMGGSSLAPEVIHDILAKSIGKKKALKFRILDSTDPGQVKATTQWAPAGKTLYIVASKSGGTAEVDALFRYFWERTVKITGNKAGRSFIAITDPGTSLESLAKERRFRRVFLADKTVGGRFSALTLFGLVPAALMGVDLVRLLTTAKKMADDCRAELPGGANPALALGALMGAAALQGRNKLTIITDESFAPFGTWLEQLIAESSGKNGRGILPVVQEPPLDADRYGKDRLFVYIKLDGQFVERVEALKNAGQPVATLEISDPYEMGGEFFRWEFAIAVACSVIGVNAFDQPDVQDSKDRTLVKIQLYQSTHQLEDGKVLWEDQRVAIYGQPIKGLAGCKRLEDVLHLFSKQIKPGDYIALNAYLPRNDENMSILKDMRTAILDHTGNATTLGFGPRFLHSTGQLYKGGDNHGVFFTVTTVASIDVSIPGQVFSFATLEHSQALGDLEALVERNRRVLRIHLKSIGLRELAGIFKKVY